MPKWSQAKLVDWTARTAMNIDLVLVLDLQGQIQGLVLLSLDRNLLLSLGSECDDTE